MKNKTSKVRLLVGLIVIGLVLSGVTAFPLRWELGILAAMAENLPDSLAALQIWIFKVRDGLDATYSDFPWIAYGTDWLAFGHLVIALFFVPVWIDPARYRANLWVGFAACLGVIPIALICGPIRGIPIFWQLIDCSFGVVCLLPIWLALKWSKTPVA